MTKPITSYDNRLQGSLLVEPLRKACKRLSNITTAYVDPTRHKVIAYAIAAFRMIADLLTIVLTAPFALLGRIIQIAHYNSLSQEVRDNPDLADTIILDPPTSIKIKRIGDNVFRLKNKENNKELFLTTPENIKPKTSLKLAQAVAQKLAAAKNANDLQDFTLEFIRWKISKGEKKQHLPALLRSFLNSFVHEEGDDGILRLNVSKAINLTAYKGTQPRHVVDHPEHALQLNPFTRLATVAYQQLEPYFYVPDYFKPEHDPYVFVKTDEGYALRARKSLTEADMPAVQEALDAYRNYIINECGEQKLKYIEHHYRCPLDSAEGLTPEHIYRISIGASNIETHDLNDFLKRLKSGGVVHAREQRGIQRVLKQTDNLSFLGKSDVSEMTPAQLNQLMSIFTPTKEEWKAIFCGRKPYEQTIAGYPDAYGRDEYKPWVDQQELLRTFPLLHKGKNKNSPPSSPSSSGIGVNLESSGIEELKKAQSWKIFYEKCAFTVCKMHLMKEHPNEDLRVGSLIPAPKDEWGQPRWYKVSKAITNGFGILHYTLESVCKDPSLPDIVLYRSTASDAAAIDSKASMHNNTNPWNSPGYENTGRTDKYWKDFIDRVTVPYWVLYMEEARKLLETGDDNDLIAAYNMLKKANEALHEVTAQPLQPKNLKKVLRSHDGLLNELYADRVNWTASLLNIWDPEYKYTDMYCELLGRYSRSKYLPSEKRQLMDAKRFKTIMLNHPATNHKEHGPHIAELVDDIARNVINPVKLEDKAEYQEFRQEIYDKVNNADSQCTSSTSDEGLRNNLAWWLTSLDSYAENKGETLAQKRDRELVFIGHSLGGACAQAQYYHFLTKNHRTVLPQHKAMLKLYDAPKINREDNEDFKAQIKKHREVLQKNNIVTLVDHNAEFNDFFSLGGEERLGAARNEEEIAELEPCLKVKAAIRKKIPSAKERTLREMATAHGSQWAQAQKGVDYQKWKFNAYEMRKLDQNKKHNKLVRKYQDIPKFLGFHVSAKQGNDLIQSPRLGLPLRHNMKADVKYRYQRFRDPNRVLAIGEIGVLSAPVEATA